MPTAIELRELEDDELENRLAEYRREMLNLRFQLATGQLDNYSRLNDAKRNVARVLTVLRDREIALTEGRDAGPVILEHIVRPPRHRPEPADNGGDDADELDEVVEAEMVEPDEDEPGAADGDDEEDGS